MSWQEMVKQIRILQEQYKLVCADIASLKDFAEREGWSFGHVGPKEEPDVDELTENQDFAHDGDFENTEAGEIW